MQMLCTYDEAGAADWKAGFDADAEGRAQAGLTLLQLWRDADAPSRAIALFEVNDKARAKAWLDRERGLGAALSATFLNTA